MVFSAGRSAWSVSGIQPKIAWQVDAAVKGRLEDSDWGARAPRATMTGWLEMILGLTPP